MFDDAPIRFTKEQKRREALRETKQREEVYARRVADGKMSQALADMRVAIMRAIADDYL